MTLARTPIDKLIEPAIQKVVSTTRGYFTKSEVVNEVRSYRALGKALAEMKARYASWKFDQIILRYIDTRVGQVLQMRDSNGIRVYECYAAGQRERRWLPLRAMTANALRSVMQETRTQARQLELKGEGYEFFMKELERLAPTATVDDVYDRVLPSILKLRAS